MDMLYAGGQSEGGDSSTYCLTLPGLSRAAKGCKKLKPIAMGPNYEIHKYIYIYILHLGYHLHTPLYFVSVTVTNHAAKQHHIFWNELYNS